MNAPELVELIRSGPAELVLDEPLPLFPRPTHPYDFIEFIEALQSSETIRKVQFCSQQTLGITEDAWVVLVKTLGRIKDIKCLEFICKAGSRDFHPFQAVADAVNNAHSLCGLMIGIVGESFSRDPSGLIALADALREHMALQEFIWADFRSQREAAQGAALDPVLWALSACPHLRNVAIRTTCASADATKNLLQLPAVTTLRLSLKADQWFAVANEIRRGRCNVQALGLVMLQGTSSDTTEVIKAVARAIQLDCNLETLRLQLENGFTDEAGVALAEALKVNKTLRKITLSAKPARIGSILPNTAALGAPTYVAFSAMLRDNTSLVLEISPLDTGVRDERLRESRKQMRIEQRLNQVGRGKLLSSSQTTREEWVDALHELSPIEVDDESNAFQVSCLYSVLRLNPKVELIDALHELSSSEGDDESNAFQVSCLYSVLRLNPENISKS
jgi:hypothetical protein